MPLDAWAQARALVSRLTSRHVGWLVFAIILVTGLSRNTWIVTKGLIEDGDFAANSILIDEAKHFQLLIGNYSRVGFHHPGPGLLYVQAWSEALFHDLLPILPRPFNAHVFGILALNAAMIGTAAAIVARRASSLLSGALLVPLALVLTWAQPGLLVSTWFPDIYVTPFLLFTIAAASVASHGYRDLPALVLAACILVHGHVSFVLFAVGVTLTVAIVAWRRWRPGDRVTARTVVTSLAILGLFVLPILVNTILHWPGELDEYLDYTDSGTTGSHSLSDVLRFIAQYWSADVLGLVLVVGVVVGAIALSRLDADAVVRQFLTTLVGVVGLITLLTFIYAYRGVDDLGFRYIAEFYVTAPLVSVLVVISAASRRLCGRAELSAWLGVVGVSLALVMLPATRGTYGGANWIAGAHREVTDAVGSRTPAVYRFPIDVWPSVAGLVEHSRRQGDAVCVQDPGLAFLFSDDVICTPEELSSGAVVDVAAQSSLPGSLVFEGPGIAISVTP